MNIKQKPILIIILILSIIGLGIISIINMKVSNSRSMNVYSAALDDYKENNYERAAKRFGKVSSLSPLKPAAIYRQGKALEHSGRHRAAIFQYNRLARSYPNFVLTPKAKYAAAQLSYELGKYSQAKRKFKHIINKYPDTDYAKASEFYLGMIEYKKLKTIKNSTQLIFSTEKALDNFRQYLEVAPGGRFAQTCINKIEELQKNKLPREDCYLIAKSYYALFDYKTALKYFDKTDVPKSWTDIVKNDYELGNYSRVRNLTERGLTEYSYNVDSKNIYEAIDLYLKVSANKKDGLKRLINTNNKANGYDYVAYLQCKGLDKSQQAGCFKNFYYQYPDGQFSADALYNVFYDSMKANQYLMAKNLGTEHLKKFPKTNSTPAVLYWMGRIHDKLKYYNDAQIYYQKALKQFPDDYYAFQSFLRIHRIENSLLKNDIVPQEIKFPYKLNKNNDMIIKLAMLKDYALLQDICESDKFIQSWISYQKGEYAKSAVTARDAMAEMDVKPDKTDLRWRLVYPIHYYNEIKSYSGENNPVIILSLIREESYFNPSAKSSVGARGLMQLMPETAEDIRKRYNLPYYDNYLYNVNANLKLGNLYYAYLRNMLNNKDFFAILAYNGGVNAVSRWKDYLNYECNNDFLEQVPYPETQNYLRKVMRSYWNYIRIY